MADSIAFPQIQHAKNLYVWIVVLFLALLAWIVTLQQTLGMFSMRMYGTMGMAAGPFLFFWTIMMVAMMFPALAPAVSVQYTFLSHQTQNPLARGVRMAGFLLGYLCLWLLFGIPVFFLAQLGDQLILHAPVVAVGLGIVVFVVAGVYQMTPLKQRCLAHCNPALSSQSSCSPAVATVDAFSDVKSGLLHGLYCLGCCSSLMLVLIAVGLMNLPWMLLVTGVVFLEKVWSQGPRLRFLLGFALIFFGLLAFIDPALLPGLYVGHF